MNHKQVTRTDVEKQSVHYKQLYFFAFAKAWTAHMLTVLLTSFDKNEFYLGSVHITAQCASFSTSCPSFRCK
jgi:hypothetical protein